LTDDVPEELKKEFEEYMNGSDYETTKVHDCQWIQSLIQESKKLKLCFNQQLRSFNQSNDSSFQPWLHAGVLFFM